MCPRSSYIADVLERREAEGRQIICQGFANARCVPALEEERKQLVHATRQPQEVHCEGTQSAHGLPGVFHGQS